MRRPTRHRVHSTFDRHPAFDYRPPAYLKAFKWAGIGVAALTVFVAGYVGFWFYAAGQLRDNALDWIEARRSEGLTVEYARLDIGGFPFALRLRVEAPALSAPEAKAPWGWKGAGIRTEMRPWSPSRISVTAEGEHTLLLTLDGQPRTFRGQAGQATGRFSFGGGQLRTANLDIADARIAETGAKQSWALNRGTLDGALPSSEEVTHRTPVLDLRLQLAGLGIPDDVPMPLGNQLTALEIGATLLGPILRGPLNESLAKWRDDGGTIEVRRLGAEYGPLVLNADGTIALDAALQPVGAFTTRVEGFFETVDALRSRGIIRAADAVTAKMILGALAKRSGNGRAGLTIPMAVQDRRLFAGPVPLIEIPEISWGD